MHELLQVVQSMQLCIWHRIPIPRQQNWRGGKVEPKGMQRTSPVWKLKCHNCHEGIQFSEYNGLSFAYMRLIWSLSTLEQNRKILQKSALTTTLKLLTLVLIRQKKDPSWIVQPLWGPWVSFSVLEHLIDAALSCSTSSGKTGKGHVTGYSLIMMMCRPDTGSCQSHFQLELFHSRRMERKPHCPKSRWRTFYRWSLYDSRF